MRIFVGNVAWTTTEDELSRLFEVLQPQDGQCRGERTVPLRTTAEFGHLLG